MTISEEDGGVFPSVPPTSPQTLELPPELGSGLKVRGILHCRGDAEVG